MARRTADGGVTRHFLAKVLGVDVRSVTNYANEGMPRAERGVYPLAACVQWFVNRERETVRKGDAPSELDLARQRKTLAEARVAEIAADEAEGNVIPLEVHELRVSALCDRLAAAVKSSGKYVGDVQNAVTAVEAAAVLERISDDYLAALRSTADELDAPATSDAVAAAEDEAA